MYVCMYTRMGVIMGAGAAKTGWSLMRLGMEEEEEEEDSSFAETREGRINVCLLGEEVREGRHQRLNAAFDIVHEAFVLQSPL